MQDLLAEDEEENPQKTGGKFKTIFKNGEIALKLLQTAKTPTSLFLTLINAI